MLRSRRKRVIKYNYFIDCHHEQRYVEIESLWVFNWTLWMFDLAFYHWTIGKNSSQYKGLLLFNCDVLTPESVVSFLSFKKNRLYEKFYIETHLTCLCKLSPGKFFLNENQFNYRRVKHQIRNTTFFFCLIMFSDILRRIVKNIYRQS